MKEIKEKLVNGGYKLTKPRVAVLGFLKKAKKPYTAKEIFGKLKSADLVSVYRTLNLLEKLEIVNVDIFEKEKKYCLANYPHHHIVCRLCGRTEEIACNERFFERIENFYDIRHQLTVTGVCDKCQ